jgi:hypothetical protein
MSLIFRVSYQRKDIAVYYPPNEGGHIKTIFDPVNAQNLAIDLYNSTRHYRTDYYQWAKRKTKQ